MAWSGQVTAALERLRDSSITESMTKYSEMKWVEGTGSPEESGRD